MGLTVVVHPMLKYQLRVGDEFKLDKQVSNSRTRRVLRVEEQLSSLPVGLDRVQRGLDPSDVLEVRRHQVRFDPLDLSRRALFDGPGGADGLRELLGQVIQAQGLCRADVGALFEDNRSCQS